MHNCDIAGTTLSRVSVRDPALQVLDEDARSQSGSFATATQQCFAARQGLSPLLDLARITFTQLTEQACALCCLSLASVQQAEQLLVQIHDLVAKYRSSHDLPNIKVSRSPGPVQNAADCAQACARGHLCLMLTEAQSHQGAGVVHCQERLPHDVPEGCRRQSLRLGSTS